MEMEEKSGPLAPILQRPGRTVYPEEARRQFLFEVFEDSEDLVEHDQEGFALLGDGFHLEEMAEEAEERAERFMKAQRQLVAGFFARRKNRLYRRAATVGLCQPDRPEPTLLLLWNLLEERGLEVDAGTEQEVNRWLSGLSEEDFLFFTQDPDLDPQRVMAAGILPSDLRPMRLFQGYRSRLLRALMKRCDFFHPDTGVFEGTLKQQLPFIAGEWELDEVELADLVREERKRFYLLHLLICKASAAFAHDQPAPASVPQEIVAEVASVAYGRMNHPDYRERALAFAGLQADQAGAIFAHLGKFMEEFYASRLFSFLKRVMGRRLAKRANRVSTKAEEKAVSSAATAGTITIHTRSVQTARQGDLATYRWGSLKEFENGRIFAPSEELLSAYKAGQIGWEDYEKRYLTEMREIFRASPDAFGKLLQKREVTLVCYESDPNRCHRRLLAALLEKVARKQGLQVILDVQ